MSERIYGYATKTGGTHIQLDEEQARALLKASSDAKAQRANDMPKVADALSRMRDAKCRLREMGWREAQYCPKDGTIFAVVELGSTGVFSSFYQGKWPDGRLYMDDFLVHPNGCMFKALDDLSDDERGLLNECDKETQQHIERDFRTFSAGIDDAS